MIHTCQGSIDLRDETLDLRFTPSPKKGVGVKGVARFNFRPGILWKTFKLGGTLANPKLVFNVGKSGKPLQFVGKAVRALRFGPLSLIAPSLKRDTKASRNPCLAAIQAAKQEQQEKDRKQ